MYIPKLYNIEEVAEAVAFMQQYSFATIVTAKDNMPVATHLPFVITQQNDTVFLRSHFARANEQWMHIGHQPILVIFSEPHAYISPAHYEKELNVPTWNYLAVHAYGRGTLLDDTAQAYALLETTINTYEPAYQAQWNNLPQDFKLKMIKGIAAFEIEVTDLQGKKKLSQNKTATEQQRIIDQLSASNNTQEQDIAAYMKLNMRP
jgi:transcriptional regulator